MARQPWDDTYDRVRVEKYPEFVYPFRPTAADLDAVEAELGCRLPASYRAFALRFGLGGELSASVRLHPLTTATARQSSILTATRRWRRIQEIRSQFVDLVVFGKGRSGNVCAFEVTETVAPLVEYHVFKFHPRATGKASETSTFAAFVSYVEFQRRWWAEEIEENEPEETPEFPTFAPHGIGKAPFLKRDVTAWLSANSGAAHNLAQTIRDEQRPDLFPILADALEDAGCTSEHLLRACRDGNPQADGEWLLAVLLSVPKVGR